MTDAPVTDAPITGSPPPKVSLREQADEAARELVMRHRVYPGLVKRGRMTEAEAAVGYLRMRAIRDTLRLLAEHEDAVRAALARAIERVRIEAEIDEAKGDPAVAAVLGEFPDATVSVHQRPSPPAAHQQESFPL